MHATVNSSGVGSGLVRWFVPDAGEVGEACGVEGFLGCADGQAGAQEGILVAVAGGVVDREAEGVRGAAVPQPEQGQLLAAGQGTVM